jgi:hypothetical protein
MSLLEMSGDVLVSFASLSQIADVTTSGRRFSLAHGFSGGLAGSMTLKVTVNIMVEGPRGGEAELTWKAGS